MNLAFAAVAELDQRGNVSALQLRAKDDDEIFLGFQFVAQLFQRVIGNAGAGKRPGSSIIAIEEGDKFAFAARRNLHKSRWPGGAA